MAYSKHFAAASKRYRPSNIRLLFIAEAPPAYRFNRFFYFSGLKDGDTLFLEMMKVLYPDIVKFNEVGSSGSFYSAQQVRLQKGALLERFKLDGFYLIDASEEPMPDRAGIAVKTSRIRATLRALRRKVRRLCPTQDVPIILIGGPTYRVCSETLRKDGFPVLNDEPINHPARGNQITFRAKLRATVRKIANSFH